MSAKEHRLVFIGIQSYCEATFGILSGRNYLVDLAKKLVRMGSLARSSASIIVPPVPRDAFSSPTFSDALDRGNARNFREAIRHKHQAVDLGVLIDRITGLTIRKAVGWEQLDNNFVDQFVNNAKGLKTSRITMATLVQACFR